MKDEGGSAFPLEIGNGHIVSPGMTLRDWFAGQALVGLTRVGISYAATNAYEYADAMIEERNKGKGE